MHVCKFGSKYCGHFGVSSLCDYCKRKYELELAAEQNEIAGTRAHQARVANDQAYEALGGLILDNPKTSLGVFLGLAGLGIAASIHGSKTKTERKLPSHGKKK